jgi:hypothetical protein
MRDARITTIYEGTTGIQANDLIGRKIAREGGATLKSVLALMRQTQDAAQAMPGEDFVRIHAALAQGIAALTAAGDYIVADYDKDVRAVAAGAVPFLELMGIVAGGWMMARAALAAQAHVASGDADPFYAAKIATARFYADHIMARAPGLAQVAAMAGADVLVLLSDVDGLYTADPRADPAATRLDWVAAITPAIEAMAGGVGSAHSKGGMKTKLMAAQAATRAGCAMAIVEGARHRPLRALAEGAPCTWFAPDGDPRAARKRWISGMKPRGRLTVDAGAVGALARGKSLLPAGVTGVDGGFSRGDPVEIAGPDGAVVAKALAGYDAREARVIMGRRSDRIAELLGYPGRAALVHRDDMAL